MTTTEGVFDCGDVSLQRGGTLKGARIVYKTFGTLSARRDNVIVYPTSYSAHHTDIEWLVGPGHALDPGRYFTVIPNMFTNGLSSSPSNMVGNTPDFPEVTTYDNVMQQRRLMADVFGVSVRAHEPGWTPWRSTSPQLRKRRIKNGQFRDCARRRVDCANPILNAISCGRLRHWS